MRHASRSATVPACRSRQRLRQGKQAAEAYLEAADLADGTERLNHIRLAATQFMITGHIEQSMPLVRQVAAASGMTIAASPLCAIAEFLFWRALTWLRGMRYRERPAAEIAQDELLRIDVCFSVVQGLALVDMIRAHPFLARGIWLALRAGEPARISRALALSAGQLAIPGKRWAVSVDRLLTDAEGLAQRAGSTLETGWFS